MPADIIHNSPKGEIILYQPDETIRIEVRLEDETVWLTQAQMAMLFGTLRQAITKHIKNIFESGELQKVSTCSILEQVQQEGKRMVTRHIECYNLDVIISVGYRVNTKRGIQFRQWANKIIKDYLLRGYAVHQEMQRMEQRLTERMDSHLISEQLHFQQIESTLADHHQKIDFFVRTNQPPVGGRLLQMNIDKNIIQNLL